MERKISFDEVKSALDKAYELTKSINDGTVDPRVASVAKAGTFGISVVLTDGRFYDRDAADYQFPLGAIAQVPLSGVLLSQNGPDELAKKNGGCCCKAKAANEEEIKLEAPLCKHGIRAVSAIVPAGDREGKMQVIYDMINGMTEGDVAFDDALYQEFTAEVAKEGAVDQLQKAGYYLYDDAALSVDIYNRLMAVKMSAKQLATMGATIAADGRNPFTKEYAFDGAIAPVMGAMMAAHTKDVGKKWLVKVGLPAKSSFAGGILAVIPGFGAIAAYSPELGGCGKSKKAAKAIELFARTLGLNVFASARVTVE